MVSSLSLNKLYWSQNIVYPCRYYLLLLIVPLLKAEMAKMFFSPWGVRLFYASIVIYLYGDLCIYVVAIPKSVQSVVWYEQLYLLNNRFLSPRLNDMDSGHMFVVHDYWVKTHFYFFNFIMTMAHSIQYQPNCQNMYATCSVSKSVIHHACIYF